MELGAARTPLAYIIVLFDIFKKILRECREPISALGKFEDGADYPINPV